ncbi:dihydropteroate synthase [Rhizobium sp. 'Codium 1']|uniref:dihydropteroate synthase n=1 Tax=Rhizobium sp. 'Codium 1' TaxID=2940484 RepID=UPI001E2E3542|nr:dihydropteroate synthase [Rhizobium sp. 'Codium 1']MCC8933577.1 dihydropteroate synthase [Rhizobium sp. 'Codium 1']
MAMVEPTIWRVGYGRTLDLSERGVIMAIVNVTPDSFSDGGLHDNTEAAVAHALACVEEGATILDIGGESTRPGAAEVSAEDEMARVLPVISALRQRTDALISIDTYRAVTARAAVAAGAHIVNDVHGLQREPDIAAVAAETGSGLCIMHTGRGRAKLADPIADQREFLGLSLDIAARAGVARETIVLDPGFGFAKESLEENMELMTRFGELHAFGLPLLVGTSRKRFLRALTGRDAPDRDAATAATTVALRLKGASVFRVHNVAINRDAVLIADAMLETERRTAAAKGSST